MDLEYQNYRRKEVQRHSLHFLFILYMVLVMFMGMDLKHRVVDELWNYQSLLMIQASVTLSMTIGLVISRQRLYFADILGPVLLISCIVGVIIANLTDLYEDIEDIETKSSYMHLIMSFIYYIIYAGLLNVRFLENFIIREVLYSVTLAVVLSRRSKYESQLDDNE